MKKVRVLLAGLGPLGQKIARFAFERECIQVVGAVDPAPDKAGRDLGVVCGLKPRDIAVAKRLSHVRGLHADVAILATVSGIRKVAPQVAELVRQGMHVISTCEELSYPWRTAPAVARRLDVLCRRHGKVCLGTGVNPGFLMDFLPCVLSAPCQRVERVIVRRIQDASSRRIPFQQKIGAGLTLAQFKAKKATGVLRHVGLTETMHMIAERLGLSVDRVTESLEPVIARRRITSGYAPIEKGMACGVEQIGRAFSGRLEVIRLEFRAAVGEPEPVDSIAIQGEPSFISVIPGGINGDIATCAIILNSIASVLRSEPGLKTMVDIPAVTYSR